MEFVAVRRQPHRRLKFRNCRCRVPAFEFHRAETVMRVSVTWTELNRSAELLKRPLPLSLMPERLTQCAMYIGNFRMQLLQGSQPFRAVANFTGLNHRLRIDILYLGSEVTLSDHGLQRLKATVVVASHKLADSQHAPGTRIIRVRL